MADSSFVRQSLTDTINRTRTLTSSRLAQRVPGSVPRPSSLVRQSSASASSSSSLSSTGIPASASKSNTRREAEEVCKVLGIPQLAPVASTLDQSSVLETPRPHSSTSSRLQHAVTTVHAGTSDDSKRIASLEERLAHKDTEIAALKKQSALFRRKVDELTAANERLETEKAAGGAGANGSRRLEELERQFEAQEQLLNGYQREAEKSMAQTEKLQAQNKKMAEVLARIHGPNWESELSLELPTGRRNRNSMTMMPTLHSNRVLADLSNIPDISTAPSDFPEGSQTVKTDALKEQLASIQMLLRSMDTRLVSRAVELEALEKRATTEAHESKARLKHLDGLK